MKPTPYYYVQVNFISRLLLPVDKKAVLVPEIETATNLLFSRQLTKPSMLASFHLSRDRFEVYNDGQEPGEAPERH